MKRNLLLCFLFLLGWSLGAPLKMAAVGQQQSKQETFHKPAMEDQDEFHQALTKARVLMHDGDADGAGFHRPESLQHGAQNAAAHGLVQNVNDTMLERLFFPFPLLGAGVNNHRTMSEPATEFFDHPDRLDACQFDINDTGVKEAPRQQRLGLFNIDAMDGSILLGIQP